MFMIDRYISVSLGRPMAINERDSNIILSAELDSDVASQIGQHEKKLLESDDRASIEAAVEEAMKVHRRLDYNVNINAQRLLEVV
ncbi:unnamed protein product [Parascedosporium putredinis]|uniref:Uncharacterized protein n=1 Tax=Parascedosporium putredinis TaxID=1442378 RepID=A0A9P1GYD5_9PEZI|nr:unnamed protein product [Parascedosporium putredinis]CAI7989814.1 unnamed protein product [Parascedosporium putredinis]